MEIDKQQIYNSCKNDPTVIFSLIKQGQFEIVEDILVQNIVNVNVLDPVGNDVITRLLKSKQYDLVLTFMKKRNLDVNHQNE